MDYKIAKKLTLILTTCLISCLNKNKIVAKNGENVKVDIQNNFIGKTLSIDKNNFKFIAKGGEQRSSAFSEIHFIDFTNGDTMSGQMFLKNDTIYFLNKDNINNTCDCKFPFCVLTDKSLNYEYVEPKCYKYNLLTFKGSYISIKQRAIQNGKWEIIHYLLTRKIDHYRQYYKKYIFSLDSGIVEYKTNYQIHNSVLHFPY